MVVRKASRFSDIPGLGQIGDEERAGAGGRILENADLLYEHLASKPKKALHPTISDGTIVQFRNAASSLVLREIDDAFGAAGIPLGSSGNAQFQGQRRTRFMDYVASVDQTAPENVSRLLVALAHMMTTLSQQYRAPESPDPLNPLIVNLRRDGFEWDGVRITESTGALVSGAVAVTRQLDLKGLHDRVHAAERSESDPAGAIGDAKELLEAVFRTVAENHGIPIDANADVTEMFKAIRDALVVAPPGVTDPAKAEAILKRIPPSNCLGSPGPLRSCATPMAPVTARPMVLLALTKSTLDWL